MKRKSVVALFLVMVLFLVLPILAQAAPIGKFTSVEGKVDVTVTGKPAVAANPGDPVSVGDIIRTKSKSKCEVLFDDGSVLRLAENSRLRVTEFAKDDESRKATLDLFRGKVQNVVKTVTGGAADKSRYEVHTPTAVAGVRGTNFFSFYQGGVSGTIFKEGTGYGYSRNMPRDIRMIRPGQAMVVTSPDLPPTIRPATDKELNKHEQDTAPSKKPKAEGEEEQDKKGGAAEAKAEESPAEDGKEKESEEEEKLAGDRKGREEKAVVEEQVEKIVEASLQADLNEGSAKVDIVVKQGTLPVVGDLANATKDLVNDAVKEVVQSDLPPTIVISPGALGTITKESTAAFTVSVRDDVSPADKIVLSYSLDGKPVTEPNFTELSEGNHVFTVTAEDETGNRSTATYTWTTDYTAPSLPTLSGTPAQLTNVNSATVSATATDAHAITYSYKLDGVASNGILTGLSEGSHTLVATATDAAGNSSSTTYTWTTDYTAPASLALGGTPATLTNLDHATVVATATDVHSITYSYTLDGAPSNGNLTGLSEGEHTLVATATDAAGNSSSTTYTWTTDYTAPETVLTGLPRKVAGTGNNFDFTASDMHLEGLYYRLNEGAWTLFTGGPLPVGEGLQNVEFKAVDRVGNESPVSSYEWFVGENLFVLQDAAGVFPGSVTITGDGSISGSVQGTSEGFRTVTGQMEGGWLIDYDGNYGTMPASFTLTAGGLGKVEGNSADIDGYWLVQTDDAAAEAGSITGTSRFTYLSHTMLGTGTGVLTGTYADSTWQATDLGLGTWNGAELKFGNDFNACITTYSAGGTFVTEYDGFMGGVSSLWSESAILPLAYADYGVPVTVMGTYIHEQPERVWDTVISGRGYDNGLASHGESDIPGYYAGFAGGLMTGGAGQDLLEGDMIALYIDPSGNAGYLKANRSFEGYAYPSIGMFRMDGNLVREEVVSAAELGIVPADFDSSIWDGYASGSIVGKIGTEGSVENDVYLDTKFLVDDVNNVSQNWGIYKFSDGGTFWNPSSEDTLQAKIGGDGYFGAYLREEIEGYTALENDYGYWLGGIEDGVWSDEKVEGTIGGKFITYTKSGEFGGELLGGYDTTAGTWEAVSLGVWAGRPSDFGGDWYHSLLYDDGGYLDWSCGNEGIFAFTKRLDNNYDFTAIGEYEDSGYGMEGFGGPYVWSGSLYYYHPSGDQTKNISAFTGGIWKKNSPASGAAAESFGIMDGYTAGMYYTSAGDVALIRGDLAGNFYGMADDGSGMWQVESVSGGLEVVDKTSVLPQGFDVTTAWIDYDSSGFTAYAVGLFNPDGEAVGNIVGEYYSGKTEFIVWDDGENSRSLPFGTYNLRMGDGIDGNWYTGKPACTSVSWKAKIGGEGNFGYDSDNSGFWLADISGSWDEYSADAGHGTINGTLLGYYLDSTYLGTIDGKVFGLYTDELDAGSATGDGTWIASSLGVWQGEKLALSGEVEVASAAFLYTTHDGDGPGEGWDEDSSIRGRMGSLTLPWGEAHTFIAIGTYTNPNNRRLWWPWIGPGSVTAPDGGVFLGDMIGCTDENYLSEGIYHALFVRPDGEGYKAGYIGYDLEGHIYPGLGPSDASGSGMWELQGTRYVFYEQPLTGVTPDNLALDGWDSSKISDMQMIGRVSGDINVDDFTTYKDSFAGQHWGIWSTSMAGGVSYLPTDGWNARAGGELYDYSGSYESGYWLADLSGDGWTDGKVNGTIAYRYITDRSMGEIRGALFGAYEEYSGAYDWQAASGGVYGGAEGVESWEKPLSFVSDVVAVGTNSAYLNMLLGGTDSLWTGSGVAVYGIGSISGGDGLLNAPFSSYNFIEETPTTYDGGAYRGFIGLATDGADVVSGGITALYYNSGKAGYLSAPLDGNVDQSLGMMEVNGTANRYEMGDAPQVLIDGEPVNLTAENFYYDGVYETGFRELVRVDGGMEPSLTSIQVDETYLNTEFPTWGIWQERMEGSVTAPGPDRWSWTTAGYNETETRWDNYSNVTWSSTPSSAAAMITGNVAGAKADWVSATTWVTGGVINGVFDPNDSTWRAIAQGAMIETGAFMAKIDAIRNDEAALQAMFDVTKIPCFQVGSTDLRGSGGGTGGTINLGSATDASYGIKNATFLAPSTGGMPQIWASGSVVGSYTGDPTGGTISLFGYAPGTGTSNGIAANFNVQQFGTATWGATITSGSVPANTLTGVTGGHPKLTFTGGAAGKIIDTSTFTGTAAGVVAPSLPPTAAP